MLASARESWKAMKNRCDNPNAINYARYGGAGIRYDPRWSSFEVFLQDMGERPAGTSLERDNNALGYNKDNCSWATAKEQANNRSSCVLVTHDGLTLNLKQWAERLGIKYCTIKERYRTGQRGERLFRKTRGYSGSHN